MTDSEPNSGFASLVSEHHFRRHEQIHSQPYVLWQIEQGLVRTLTWDEGGVLSCLGIWGAGDVVGHSLSQMQPYQIECLTSVKARLLPKVLWNQVLDAIILHGQQTEQLLGVVAHAPASVRLWEFLTWLGQKFGRDTPQGRLIDLRLTHQQIGETIHLTRVMVTRTLQQFEAQGRLCRRKGQIFLC